VADQATGSLWDFSLVIYRSESVQVACLGLQDRHGLDVNILLLCCWLAARGEAIDRAGIDAVLAETNEWQSTVVVPLRAIRRQMKGGIHPIPGKDAKVLRARIKMLELEAERIEQQQLEFVFAQRLHLPSGDSDRRGLAMANLAAYFSALQIEPGKEDTQDLNILADKSRRSDTTNP